MIGTDGEPTIPGAKAIIERALTEPLVDEDGRPAALRLLPGLTPPELDALSAALPAPLPPDIAELLAFTAGFAEGPLESVDFRDLGGVGLEEILPTGLDIAHDGYGNYWRAEIQADGAWGPVLFACHDPAVIVYQATTVAEFLDATLDLYRSGRDSAVDRVHEQATMLIWHEDPYAVPAAEARSSADPALAAFARPLDDTWRVTDLRDRVVGKGFKIPHWRSRLLRMGTELVFAVEQPERPGLLGRLRRRRD